MNFVNPSMVRKEKRKEKKRKGKKRNETKQKEKERKAKRNFIGVKLVRETPSIFQTIFTVIDFSSKFCCTNGSNYRAIRKLRQRGWVTCSRCCYLEPASWASLCSSPPHPIHTPSRWPLWIRLHEHTAGLSRSREQRSCPQVPVTSVLCIYTFALPAWTPASWM